MELSSTSLECKAPPETIKLEDQTNYRLIEIGKTVKHNIK